MSELDTTGIDIDQLPNDISKGDLFDLIHKSSDSGFWDFNANELPDSKEHNALDKAMRRVALDTPRLDKAEIRRLFQEVQKKPTWSNLREYLDFLAQFGEIDHLGGTRENIEKKGIVDALPQKPEEKIEEQQIMAKGFLNAAERYKRNALVYRKYLKYDEAQGVTHSAVDHMNMAVQSLKTVKYLRSFQMQNFK